MADPPLTMSVSASPSRSLSPGSSSWWGRQLAALGRADRPVPVALFYLAAFALAETMTVLVEPRVGQALYLIVLFILLIHVALTWGRPAHRFLLSLSFVPLIRVISLSLPLAGIPLVFWYLIVSIPLFASALVSSRMLRLRQRARALRGQGLLPQLAFALTGLLFGYLEYLILRPEPLLLIYSWDRLLIAAAILLFSTGYLEELMFRGIMQRMSVERLGPAFGVAYVALIFAVLHIGYRSLLDVIFVLVVGLFFGWFVARSGSLLGVTLSHSLTNIVLFLAIPYLASQGVRFGSSPPEPLLLQADVRPLPTAAPTVTPTPQAAAETRHQPGSSASDRAPTPTPTASRTAQVALEPTPTSAAVLRPTALPSPSPTNTAMPCGPAPATWVPYVVQPGDTLAALARDRSTTSHAIQQSNCLVDGRLYYHTRILLPPAVVVAGEPSRAPEPSPLPSPTAVPPAVPAAVSSPVVITSPAPGSAVSGVVPIVGTADFDPAVVHYYKIELSRSQVWNPSWVTVGQTHATPVVEGTLEWLHANTLAPGTFRLRLTLIDWGGNVVGQPYTIRIEIR